MFWRHHLLIMWLIGAGIVVLALAIALMPGDAHGAIPLLS